MATGNKARPLGRRGERLRVAVLSATVDLLVREGFDATTVAAAAEAAGVHESSVYRRWGTRENLIREAVEHNSDTALPIPDTGRVDEDLRLYAASLVRFLNTPSAEVLLRLGAGRRTGADATESDRFWTLRLHRAAVIVDRAVARGELRADTRSRLLIEALSGTLFTRTLFAPGPLPDDLADPLVEQLLEGVRARPR
ncbi:TetR-like C-terminal domain-containing protein [uncultured Streptomyces sp.]|uniref:TetR-like C-terminal domain-containing protein n=1 Tax=uncultured Streptomyces sp. TaxID=174707 RepID=UPI00262BE71E|nr:TetR-like C-terminal domain-containing protein [uncultured Streptomyces sp.]